MFKKFCFNDKEALNLSPFEAYTDLMLKRILFIFLTIMACGSAAAQEFDETLTLYFRHGEGDYDRKYRSNGDIADEFLFGLVGLVGTGLGGLLQLFVFSHGSSFLSS